jgi:hypothetical protein
MKKYLEQFRNSSWDSFMERGGTDIAWQGETGLTETIKPVIIKPEIEKI